MKESEKYTKKTTKYILVTITKTSIYKNWLKRLVRTSPRI